MAGTPEFLHLYQPDLSGVIRGKSLILKPGHSAREVRLGWIPSNALITCFGDLTPAPVPEIGDVLMVPAQEQIIELEVAPDAPVTRLLPGRVVTLSDEPWVSCPRSVLEQAIQELEELGLRLVVGLEQEFYLLDSPRTALNAYTLDSLFEEEPFLIDYARLLDQAGVRLKSLHAENGAAQYEVTLGRNSPMEAADQLTLIRLVADLLAQRKERRLSFSPIVDPGKVGSGLHVHFSLQGTDGSPRNCDPSGKPSAQASSFLQGILGHIEAVLAFSSPSVISAMRYRPPRWTAYFNNFAEQDRKAAIRMTRIGEGPESTHFEFRTADATANPYLMLAAVIRAGMLGLKEQGPPLVSLPTHQVEQDPSTGVRRLPETLAASLDALEADASFRAGFSKEFLHTYLLNKRHEITLTESMSEMELLQRYSSQF